MGTVFNTDVTEDLGQAGSIPVRLRQTTLIESETALDDPRRGIPATDALLADPRLAAACERLGRVTVLNVIRRTQDDCRRGHVRAEDVYDEVLRRLPQTSAGLRSVINATGVVVHTNLGRAPLSYAAREALSFAAGATNVELDLETGSRGRRGRSA